jgi:hypothetical protein
MEVPPHHLLEEIQGECNPWNLDSTNDTMGPFLSYSSNRGPHSGLDHPRSDSRLFDPNGVDTVSNADGGLTPGSTFDASEVDRYVIL